MLTLILALLLAQPHAIDPDTQIRAALEAAPEAMRSAATVLGWLDGRLEVLREGSGSLICEADDPNADGYASSCYHREMAAYIERGRQLRADGRSFGEVRDIRAQEVEEGSLAYPSQPVTSYFLYGDDGRVDPETGEVKHVYRRYVVYVPYATVESSGLADSPVVPGAPWLMDAGTYHAHIMITPAPDRHR